MVRTLRIHAWRLLSVAALAGTAACGGVLQDGTSHGTFRDGIVAGGTGSGATTGGGTTSCLPLGQALSAPGDSIAAGAAVLSMELDSAGQPAVAWTFGSAAATKPVFVAAFDGSRWQGLAGSDAGPGLGNSSGGVGLKVDSKGRPLAAWLDASASPAVFVKSWSGAGWTGLAGSDAGLAQAALGTQFPAVRLALTPGDLPVLLWQESTGPGNVNGSQWSGTAWNALAPHSVFSPGSTPVAAFPELLRGTDGSPVTLYTDGSGLSVSSAAFSAGLGVNNNNGTSASTATRVAGAIDAAGNIAVGWQDTNLSGTLNIFLKVITATGGLNDLAGSGMASGLSQSSGGAQHTSLAMDADGHPVIVWEDMATHQVVLRHWNGTAWVSLAGAPNTVSQAKTLAAWPVVRVAHGAAIVAWHEDGASIRVCSLAL